MNYNRISDPPRTSAIYIGFLALMLGIGTISSASGSVDTVKSPQFAKTRLSDEELAKKSEGVSFMAFPGPGYDPDLGFVIGALAGYYNHGRRTDKYFAYEPYRYALSYLGSWSTQGLFSSILDFDCPYVKNSPYRLRSRLSYVRNISEPYFGTGEQTLQGLRAPDGKSYSSYDNYVNDLLAIDSGKTNASYNYYRNEYAQATINIERIIQPGSFRITGGLSFVRAWPHDYTGDTVQGSPSPGSDERAKALMNSTRLEQDYRSGAISGFRGGWTNDLRIGFVYDTRDLESNPRRGMFDEAIFVAATPLLGSDFSYTISTLSARWFFRPFGKSLDLISAARLAACVKTGNVPFFAMNYIPTTDNYIYGLGGGNTLRGYALSRFVGPVMTFGNYELRYVFADFKIKQNLVELMFVPFIDFGRVYDRLQNLTFDDMKYSYGAGLRTGYSQSFVLCFDFGFSEEQKAAFYMSFGTIF